MKDLIERLEKATGPDRELDIAIFRAITGDPWRWVSGGEEITWDKYGQRAAGNPVCSLEEFTGSIDAALSLVPKGLTWQVTGRVEEDGDFSADVDIDRICDSAPTPAIALCIAALKARETAAAQAEIALYPQDRTP